MQALLIGEVSRRTGLSAPTIRYYEDIGVLTKPSRATSGYRTYSPQTVDELLFIRKARNLGFSLEEIAEILRLSRSGQKPCERVLKMAQSHLESLDQRIRDLQNFRGYLARETKRWKTGGAGPRGDTLCQLIADAETDASAGIPEIPLRDRLSSRRRRDLSDEGTI